MTTRRVVVIAIIVAIIIAPITVLAADLAHGFFGGVDVVSTDPDRTAMGVRGTEDALGTFKATHEPSAQGATDPSAAVISTRSESDGANGSASGPTATQAWFHDYPDGAASGTKIINLRVHEPGLSYSTEVFRLQATPTPEDPARVTLYVNGPIVTPEPDGP